MKLNTLYGSTESGIVSHAFKRTKEDEVAWDYIEFDATTNVRWVPQGDETYECQLLVSNYIYSLDLEAH